MKMECPKTESVEDETTPTRRRSRNRKFIKLTNPEPDMFEAKTSSEDTCLKVDGKCLYASSSILSLASPTFKSQIEEKVSSKAPLEIELEGKRYKDVLEFLKCIYPSIMQRLSMKNVPIVMPLAFEYQVKPLTRNCEAVILEELEKAKNDENSNPDDICLYLVKAFEYNLPDLQKICLELAADNYDDLPKKKVKSLPVEAKAELQSRVIEAMNEEMEAKKEEHKSLSKFAELKGVLGLPELMDWVSSHASRWNLKRPRIGYLEYTFSIDEKKTTLSTPITVNGISWCIEIHINETTLEVYLTGKLHKACTCNQAWKCRVNATLRLHNFKYASTRTHTYDKFFLASSNSWGLRDFAKMTEVRDKDGGYNKDGMARVEIYMYAEEPTFE